MSFNAIRRQQFLAERYVQDQLAQFEAVLNDPDGLEANLRQPERERGWYASLARGVGFEKFSRMLLRYTAGEDCSALRTELDEIVSAYERYGIFLWKDTENRNDPVFEFDVLDAYCQLLQLVGLCFLLHRRDLLPRIAAFQDGADGKENGGCDTLYEEFMAFCVGPEARFETDMLCQLRPYQDLFNGLTETTPAQGLTEIDLFLKHWYKDLAGTGWHDSHKPDEHGNQGGYYGYWSFEAGAAVLLLGIEDDSSLHKYLYYPKDMVAWARAHAALSTPDEKAAAPLCALAGEPCPREGWWLTPAKLDSRRKFRQGETMPEVGGDYSAAIWQWDATQG